MFYLWGNQVAWKVILGFSSWEFTALLWLENWICHHVMEIHQPYFTDIQSVFLFKNDFRVAYKLPWRLTEVPFLKFHFVPGMILVTVLILCVMNIWTPRTVYQHHVQLFILVKRRAVELDWCMSLQRRTPVQGICKSLCVNTPKLDSLLISMTAGKGGDCSSSLHHDRGKGCSLIHLTLRFEMCLFIFFFALISLLRAARWRRYRIGLAVWCGILFSRGKT